MEQSAAGRRFREGKLDPDLFYRMVVLLRVCVGVLAVEFCVVDMAVAGKILILLLPWSCPPNACRTYRADVTSQAFRNLNAVTVPAFVSVPKTEEEDSKKGN